MTQRLLFMVLLVGVTAFGQRGGYDIRRAEIRGGGGDGKCTIEVEVDDTAEVEIIGDTARLRTLAGRPAIWRRFVCNQVMPRDPNDFRFRGIDGRGRQDLVRDPRNGGPAVVRIYDSRGGSEGYTFDIEWRGGGGGDWRGGGDRRGFGGGGWSGRQGDTFDFRGDGRGFLNRRNGRDMRVRDVVVSLARDGRVVLEFEAQGFQRLFFGGRATQFSRDSITADLTGGAQNRNTRGGATIYLDRRGEVDRIMMDGRIGDDPFRLDWSAR